MFQKSTDCDALSTLAASHLAFHFNDKYINDILGRDSAMMRGATDMAKIYDPTIDRRTMFSGNLGSFPGTPEYHKRRLLDSLAIMKGMNRTFDYWHTGTANQDCKEVRQNLPGRGRKASSAPKILGDVFNRMRLSIMDPKEAETGPHLTLTTWTLY